MPVTDDIEGASSLMHALERLSEDIVSCGRCPRLVAWRERVAEEKVRRFAQETYWGKPLSGFGDAHAQLVIVGLAPAAHGGNRTGRMFTGDSSADWLVHALYVNGFANQPHSVASNDGLALRNAYVTAAVRCAPPQNKPTAEEVQACRPYLEAELRILAPRVIVALGRVAFQAVRHYLKISGSDQRSLIFKHGAQFDLELPSHSLTLIASYHPSRQNTQTGKLTVTMFNDIFQSARAILESP
ncbi:uracil-DNA glycosylase [Sulfobacillus sp. hq2]|uniref:uracil-DNA glycosylase n=1 Tax=Sulfobacillus TaxID=28033 RepID=UPI0026870F5E|nr:uracil-DNA glycosylase [Sulfobacillus sp. hq2]